MPPTSYPEPSAHVGAWEPGRLGAWEPGSLGAWAPGSLESWILMDFVGFGGCFKGAEGVTGP